MAKSNHQLQLKKGKALTLMQKGLFDEAENLLRRLCKSFPKDHEIWLIRSAIKGELGMYDEVATYCKRAISLSKNQPAAYSNLANAQVALGQRQDAIINYNQALELLPNDAIILNNLGNAYRLNGNHDEAINHINKALKIDPNCALAYYNLGNAFRAIDNLENAIEAYQASLGIKPYDIDCLYMIGVTHSDRGNLDIAIECLQKALDLDPEKIEILYSLALAHGVHGNLQEAENIYNKALSIAPDESVLLAGLADIYHRKGRKQEAYDILISLDNNNTLAPRAIGLYAKICKNYKCCDHVIEKATAILANPILTHTQKKELHYAKAYIYDEDNKYEEAFNEYCNANLMANYRYDEKATEDKVDKTISAFSRDSLENLPKSNNKSDLSIFIIGMPRSGTSLVEQIIASHSKVTGAGELNNISKIRDNLHITLNSDNKYPECISDITIESLDLLSDQYISYLKNISDTSERVTDKMPHNFINLGLINLMLPSAKIIHCKRNPLDTCLSIFFQNLSKAHLYSTNLNNIAHFYKEYMRLMRHWTKAIKLPVMEINYEELISDPETNSRKLIEFCDLDWEKNCLSFYKSDRYVATASYDQVRNPIYSKSVNRWRNYEPFIKILVDDLED